MKKFFVAVTAAVSCVALLTSCAQSSTSSRHAKAAASRSAAASKSAVASKSAQASGDVTKVSAPSLTLFAAASTRVINDELQALPELADTKITFNNDGSPSLVQQIEDGGPADVLVTADEKNMQKAVDAGLVDAPVTLATNSLVLVVPKDNPKKIKSWDDFVKTKNSATVVTCDLDVPCGNVADQVLKENKVEVEPASLETSVSNVLGKVTSGEADAGFVYATDAAAAGDAVTTIEIPNAQKHRNKILAAVVKSSTQQEGAKQLVDLLKSQKVAELWKTHGFESAS